MAASEVYIYMLESHYCQKVFDRGNPVSRNKGVKMSSTSFLILLCILLSSVLLADCGTIHSSLGTGETNRGWKPGGKRGMDCLQLQSEVLFTILEVVKEEVQKISNCERIHFGEKAIW
ncbi:hypothetical protein HNY73_005699 [Argiope bruennichi]|uniref:Uncharacterized protein n=1 Tax=Argiope bruennichi TaxID=94029 RepID=A0A8T0FPP9_ARGBR|nr:hypothetical protein HNY73_005699 [Argiope bruennichi]